MRRGDCTPSVGTRRSGLLSRHLSVNFKAKQSIPPLRPPPLPHHISEEEEMFLFPPPPSVYYGGMYADCLGYGADDTNARGQGMRIIM